MGAAEEVTVAAWLFRIPGATFPVAIDQSWNRLDGPVAGAPVYDVAHRLGLADEPANATVCYFCREQVALGIVIDREPQLSNVRRLVAAAPPTIGEVIVIEATEGLILHPERLR